MYLRLFVNGQIIEDHHVARPKRRDEYLLDVGEKRGIVERAVKDRRRAEALDAQRSDHRVGLPVATRRMVPEPRAPRTAPIPPQQIGGDARLIDEDVAARVVERLRVAPAAAGGRDIRAALLVSVYRFF